ncbi:hypothetical protein [Tritonibacter mobilis]|uniref:Lipoprotein n=1 Tax=Tritonibacter mobilis F1926 TaxID=1265309 RepID=A0A1B1A128_9RHOB|nr:hypothetical protein [Tritonibacter mobilis]ANP40216.1 hypothetical protein K529_005495 [Tritonibacter mobilis F1926]KJZ25412.1 hypothetical protein TW79_07110 [Tritonibacter mobilis]
MRKTGLILSLLLASGCMTTEYQYKAGITPQQRRSDISICERRATQQFPVANKANYTPRYWVPPVQHCKNGNCYYRGGHWAGGQTDIQDQNLLQRKRAFAQCLGQKGYQSIATTSCTGKVRDAVLRSPQGRYPRLTANSCTVGMSDGTLKVYSPQ